MDVSHYRSQHNQVTTKSITPFEIQDSECTYSDISNGV